MSDAASASDPQAKPSRAGRLLNLVRKLIDYGRELVTTVRQLAATDPLQVWVEFGTRDVAKILDHISRALLRADALEARLTRNGARLDREPKPASTPRSPRKPRPPAPEADPVLARLPTPEEIAAEVRRRPIGAVIVDICLDLGIACDHPLWPEIEDAIVRYGGSLVRLIRETIRRAMQQFDPYQPFDFGVPPPGWSPPTQAPNGTGPP